MGPWLGENDRGFRRRVRRPVDASLNNKARVVPAKPASTAQAARSLFLATDCRLPHASEIGHDAWVRKRRRVAQHPVLGNVAEQSAHDLPGARFWQIRREHDLVRTSERPNLVRDELSQLLAQLQSCPIPLA